MVHKIETKNICLKKCNTVLSTCKMPAPSTVSGMLQEYTSKKQTVCKEKQKFINKYNCQCEIRNCFICLNRTLQ